MFADLHGDPLRTMWTNASSASNRASVSFAAALVQRFSSNTTVFAWEIGNEHNLLTDLNCSGQTWGCAPQLGTPAVRTSADSSSSRDYLLFQSSIVAVIRQHDSLRRPISSGHSLPRPSAYHLMQSFPRSDWTLDSIEQVSGIAHSPTSYTRVNFASRFAAVPLHAPADGRWLRLGLRPFLRRRRHAIWVQRRAASAKRLRCM